MKKTVLRLRRETSDSLRINPENGLVGYSLKVSVDLAHNIDPNIFVIQRDVLTNYTDGTVDTFYSIASVPELEHLPTSAPNTLSVNFYRTSSIELVFESISELEEGWKKISAEVMALAEANDLSINMVHDVVAVYPQDAFPRYYGLAESDSPDTDEIVALTSDILFTTSLFLTLDVSDRRYLVVAFPNRNASVAFSINGELAAFEESVVTIQNAYGVDIEYKVYVSSGMLPVGLVSIASGQPGSFSGEFQYEQP